MTVTLVILAVGATITFNSDHVVFTVLGVVILLVGVLLGGLVAYAYLDACRPIDNRAKDPVYVRLRTLLRESLLPRGFQERQEACLGFVATYTRGEYRVVLGVDVRDNEYYFFVSRETGLVPGHGPHQLPTRVFQLTAARRDGDQFEAQVRQKLQEWSGSTGSERRSGPRQAVVNRGAD